MVRIKQFAIGCVAFLFSTGFEAPLEAPTNLVLSCSGLGTKIQPQTSTAYAYGSDGYSASGGVTTYRRESFEERLLLSVSGAEGKVRLPRSLVPPINSGASDGWWPLTDLVISEDAISGRFRLNFVNKPQVRVDRRTGDIELAGFNGMSFRGVCERLDPAQRKF